MQRQAAALQGQLNQVSARLAASEAERARLDAKAGLEMGRASQLEGLLANTREEHTRLQQDLKAGEARMSSLMKQIAMLEAEVSHLRMVFGALCLMLRCECYQA